MQKPPNAQNPVAKAMQEMGGQTPSLIAQSLTHVHEGPIPAPEVMAGYERLLPGSADRILSMAERQEAHRQKLEQEAQDANVAAQQRQLAIAEGQQKAVFRSDVIGQVFGIITCTLCVIGSVYLAMNGHEKTAIALAALPTAAVIRSFFVDRAKTGPGAQK